ncbi:hypothetical protein [Kribbella qitaiheensis]|uniref:hypothetical protein n=1 Tax=Kribbella qitaiheensis TaxID=1544730 RepID=UPI0019D67676|nr:hypothetical protein [Kribbella qitaiheensis]
MSQLLLWDVDHTLIENSGISKAIYSSAFRRLTSQAPHQSADYGRYDGSPDHAEDVRVELSV